MKEDQQLNFEAVFTKLNVKINMKSRSEYHVNFIINAETLEVTKSTHGVTFGQRYWNKETNKGVTALTCAKNESDGGDVLWFILDNEGFVSYWSSVEDEKALLKNFSKIENDRKVHPLLLHQYVQAIFFKSKKIVSYQFKNLTFNIDQKNSSAEYSIHSHSNIPLFSEVFIGEVRLGFFVGKIANNFYFSRNEKIYTHDENEIQKFIRDNSLKLGYSCRVPLDQAVFQCLKSVEREFLGIGILADDLDPRGTKITLEYLKDSLCGANINNNRAAPILTLENKFDLLEKKSKNIEELRVNNNFNIPLILELIEGYRKVLEATPDIWTISLIELRLMQLEYFMKLCYGEDCKTLVKDIDFKAKQSLILLAKSTQNKDVLNQFLYVKTLVSFSEDILPIFIEVLFSLPVEFIVTLAKKLMRLEIICEKGHNFEIVEKICSTMISTELINFQEKNEFVEILQELEDFRIPEITSLEIEKSNSISIYEYLINKGKLKNKDVINLVKHIRDLLHTFHFGINQEQQKTKENIKCIIFLLFNYMIQQDNLLKNADSELFKQLADIMYFMECDELTSDERNSIDVFKALYEGQALIGLKSEISRQTFVESNCPTNILEIRFIEDVRQILFNDESTEIKKDKLKTVLAKRYESFCLLGITYELTIEWPTSNLAVMLAKFINRSQQIRVLIPAVENLGYVKFIDDVNFYDLKDLVFLNDCKTAINIKDLFESAKERFKNGDQHIFIYLDKDGIDKSLSEKDKGHLKKLFPGIEAIFEFCHWRASQEKENMFGWFTRLQRFSQASSVSGLPKNAPLTAELKEELNEFGKGEEFSAGQGIYPELIAFKELLERNPNNIKDILFGLPKFEEIVTRLLRSDDPGGRALSVRYCLDLIAGELDVFINSNAAVLKSLKTDAPVFKAGSGMHRDNHYLEELKRLSLNIQKLNYSEDDLFSDKLMPLMLIRCDAEKADLEETKFLKRLSKFCLKKIKTETGKVSKRNEWLNIFKDAESLFSQCLFRSHEESRQQIMNLYLVMGDLINKENEGVRYKFFEVPSKKDQFEKFRTKNEKFIQSLFCGFDECNSVSLDLNV